MNGMKNEQVAFAFIRELQKRFNPTTPLGDIEMAQEQGWRHDVAKVCEAYDAAHAKVNPDKWTSIIDYYPPENEPVIMRRDGSSWEWRRAERRSDD